MAIAHVQTPAGGAANVTATSIALAFGSNVAAGSAIVVSWKYSASGRTVTLSDTQSNVYTSNAVEAFDSGDTVTTGIGYALNVTGGACTVTFAISGAASNLRFMISEFSGVATSAALDKTATATGNSTTPAAGSVTPTTNGQLLYAATHGAAAVTYTAGTDFTLNTTVPTTALAQRMASERYIQPTAAAHNGNFSATTTGTWGCVLATFKDNSGGAPTPITFITYKPAWRS